MCRSRSTNTRRDAAAADGWRKRVFAWMQAKLADRYEPLVAQRKTELLSPLSGIVLEIGPGAGANLPYYSRSIRWIGIEPNPYMHGYLRRRADEVGLTVDLRHGWGEAIKLGDNSVDAVVMTLVLCSVEDPRRVLGEVMRVLRPGGKFVFIEHVAAPSGSMTRLVQRLVRPLWSFIADGCRPDRETLELIQRAGFERVDHVDFRVPLPVVGPHVMGVAVKPSGG